MNVNRRLTFGMISGSRGICVKCVNSFEPDHDFHWGRWFHVWSLLGVSPTLPTPLLPWVGPAQYGIAVLPWRQPCRCNVKPSAHCHGASRLRPHLSLMEQQTPRQLTLSSGFLAGKQSWACSHGKIKGCHCLFLLFLLCIKKNLYLVFYCKSYTCSE